MIMSMFNDIEYRKEKKRYNEDPIISLERKSEYFGKIYRKKI